MSTSFTIPTPFGKRPWEFTIGFRYSYLIIGIAYILAITAFRIDNFNLGVFSIVLIYLTTYTYFIKPEDEFFVWIFKQNPLQFLLSKVKTAMLYSLYLTLPLLILLSISRPELVWFLLLFTLMGSAVQIAMICAKYSNYPNEIGMKQFIIIICCLVIPPMLLVAIPYMGSQAINQLKGFLEC